MSDTDSVAEDMLRAGYERWLRLEEEKDAIGGDLKELFAELKGNGFTPKALRESFRRVRNIGDASQQEHDAIVDLYVAALTGARPARTREDDIHHDADGVVIVEEIPAVVSPAQPNGEKPETPAVAAAVGETADNSEPVDRLAADADSDGGTAATAPVVPQTAHRVDTVNAADSDESEATSALVAPFTSVDADAGADRSEGRAPSSTLAPVAKFQTHNPDTHFLSKTGLPRLYGCNKPEACAGSWRNLCFACSVVHDGPPPQAEAVN